mmetsp:Transcript_18813/g.45415  ORF Transcript_18813/g.45415 Transcript_18813/m.45415 type:complete len:574 (+) Transcript_18813:39-1760(+)
MAGRASFLDVAKSAPDKAVAMWANEVRCFYLKYLSPTTWTEALSPPNQGTLVKRPDEFSIVLDRLQVAFIELSNMTLGTNLCVRALQAKPDNWTSFVDSILHPPPDPDRPLTYEELQAMVVDLQNTVKQFGKDIEHIHRQNKREDVVRAADRRCGDAVKLTFQFWKITTMRSRRKFQAKVQLELEGQLKDLSQKFLDLKQVCADIKERLDKEKADRADDRLRYESRIESLEQLAAERKAHGEKLAKQLMEESTKSSMALNDVYDQLKSTQTQLAEAQETIAFRDATLEKRNTAIEELQSWLQEARDVISQRDIEISRLQQILRDTIQRHAEEVAGLQQRIADELARAGALSEQLAKEKVDRTEDNRQSSERIQHLEVQLKGQIARCETMLEQLQASQKETAAIRAEMANKLTEIQTAKDAVQTELDRVSREFDKTRQLQAETIARLESRVKILTAIPIADDAPWCSGCRKYFVYKKNKQINPSLNTTAPAFGPSWDKIGKHARARAHETAAADNGDLWQPGQGRVRLAGKTGFRSSGHSKRVVSLPHLAEEDAEDRRDAEIIRAAGMRAAGWL